MAKGLSDKEIHRIWKKWKDAGGVLETTEQKPIKPDVPTLEQSRALIESMVDDLMGRPVADPLAGVDPELREIYLEQGELINRLMKR